MNELEITFQGTGNLYAILRRRSDEFVRETATGEFVDWDDADIDNYDIPLTSQGGDIYAADIPADLPVGEYRVLYYERGSSTPATSDLLLNSKPFRWTGTSTAEPSDPGDPTSLYIEYNAFLRRWGSTNVRVASNLNNKTTTINKTRVQESFDNATDELHGLLNNTIYTTPLDFSPNGGVVPARVMKWASVLAYGDLYFSRGIDERTAKTNKISLLEKQVRDEIGLVRVGVRSLPEARLSGAYGSVPSNSGISVVKQSDIRSCYGYKIINGVLTYGWWR